MSAPVDEPVLRCDLQLPPMDGDIAWLHHLRSEVYSHMPAPISTIPADFIWDWSVHATGIDPDQIVRSWPFDLAGRILDDWLNR